MPWIAGLAVLALAVALAWLFWRLSATRRRLARLQRAAATDDPRLVAGQLASFMARRHRLLRLSAAACPAGVDAMVWRAWVEALDALRFGVWPGDRALLARLCRDARDL